MQVDFYHLTLTPLERALPRITERILADGGRLLIVSAAEPHRQHLDRMLWSYTPDSFLPHGLAGDGEEAEQPVLIADHVSAVNGARHVALVDGQWRDAALAFDRAFHFFDDDAIEAARIAWRGLSGREGVERRYWKQGQGGRWEKVA